MRLLLLAPPGAGKGTQGERLAAWSGARHIAAGDLLRAEAQAGGRLGREIAAYQVRGDLVPDQIVLDVLTLPGAAGQSSRLSYPVAGSPDGLKFLARRPGYGLSPPAGSHAEVAVGIDFSRDEGVRPIRVFRWSACERSPLATPGSPLTD